MTSAITITAPPAGRRHRRQHQCPLGHRCGHPRPHLRAVHHRPRTPSCEPGDPGRASVPASPNFSETPAGQGSRGTAPQGDSAGRRRKQEGAVYTPAFITRYLVGQALGGVLKHRFDTLRRQQESQAAGTARKALADPNAYDLTALNEPQRKALIRFWEAWQEEGKTTTPSARATASSATRPSIPKPSTGKPPSPKSSPKAASMSSSATRPPAPSPPKRRLWSAPS